MTKKWLYLIPLTIFVVSLGQPQKEKFIVYEGCESQETCGIRLATNSEIDYAKTVLEKSRTNSKK